MKIDVSLFHSLWKRKRRTEEHRKNRRTEEERNQVFFPLNDLQKTLMCTQEPKYQNAHFYVAYFYSVIVFDPYTVL